MTYPDTIRLLYGLRLHGLKLGLENTRLLARLAGNPQDQLRFVHVAGTNGKGSTCAMLESVYRSAGLKVGLFTSPHLVSFRERIQINRNAISEEDVVQRVAVLASWFYQFPADHPPTFFEVITVLALRYFADHACDLVVWETGMGGRLDATNIVQPLASLITNIQFDHQNWLGTTRAAIATEKAGILKPHVPALTATDDPEALDVITRLAIEKQAPLTIVPPVTHATDGLPTGWTIPLQGLHQRTNATLAFATVMALQPHIPVPPDIIRTGLASVRWQGRMQLVKRRGGRELLLDGAHNLAGMEALVQTLQTEFAAAQPVFILGMLRDKDWQAMGSLAAAIGRRVLLVPVHSERSASPEELADACRRSHPHADVATCSSLVQALEATDTEPFVVIAGSLYLVGEAIELLGLAPGTACAEHELNEWLPPKSR